MSRKPAAPVLSDEAPAAEVPANEVPAEPEPIHPTRPSSLTTGASRHDILNSLVRRYLEGRDLPEIINGDALEPFLGSFRYDQGNFNTDLAARLELQSSPALNCEAALSLKARLKL